MGLRRLFLVSAAALAALSCRTTDERAKARPLSLFNGETLEGWNGDPRFWRVENGAIVGESTPANPCERTTYLVREDLEAEDFELELAFRIAGGNSGVQFRSRASGELGVAGYQADLDAAHEWTGGLYEQDGRGVVARRGERVVLGSDGTRTVERFADGEELLRAVDPVGWNEYRIVAFGPRLSLSVNGELTSEVIDLDPERASRSGGFALQLHAGAPMRVEFKDLRLRDLTPSTQAAASFTPRWIWPKEEAAENERAWFRRSFELASRPARAELWASGDNRFEVWINGELAARGADWTRPLATDVASLVRSGANELAVRAENEGGPAALCLALEGELESGESFALATDSSWHATNDEPARGWLIESVDWPAARDLGPLGVEPWGPLAAHAGEGSALDAQELELPQGFHAELLYSVPLAREGSWISLEADDRGGLYACDQYGGLYRIEPAPLGSGGTTRVQALDLALGEAHGLAWAFGALYAVVSGAGEFESGLYRARDADGDGELDRVDRLASFDGDGEHGPHAVLPHPDGRSLVLVGGNHCKLPAPIGRQRLPPHWAEDALLPQLFDPNGHAVDIRAPGGWICRTDPDAQRFELIAAGFRNAYDAAFTAHGELFTFDSDMEWDLGLPWYRPARILHVVSGAEFGWRTGSGNWPADAFDSLPAAVDVGRASPTGMVCGARTHFPPPWRDALFAADWAFGTIYAVHLEEAGATYRGEVEPFARGRAFPVTDLAVGLEGALYVTTGGRGLQSGLYRISYRGDAPPAASRTPSDPGAAADRMRRELLEAFHGVRDPEAVELGFAHLGDPDRFVRYAARIALESQDPELWSDRALAETDPRRALEALLALVHADPGADADAVIARILSWPIDDFDRELLLDAFRLAGLALIRLDPSAERQAELASRLEPLYPSSDARLDRELLALLARLDDGRVIERALDTLERSSLQDERVHAVHALSAFQHGWTAELSDRYLTALERALERVQGGESARGYVERIHDDARERFGVEPAETEIASTPTSFRTDLPRSSVQTVHSWTVDEIASSLSRLESARSAERGRAAYARTDCASCHRLGGEGASRGPDLDGAGARFSARDLLTAILEPSRVVPDVWRDTEFRGADGELLAVGRLQEETAATLVVRTTSGELVEIPRNLIAERTAHPLSRMPEGLLDPLSEEEVLDLLAFVLGTAREAAPAFRSE